MSSPGNYRPDVTDVVLIFTDGEPIRRRNEDKFGDKYRSSRYGEGLLAKDRAQSLREKDVTVVGLAVGTEVTLSRFRDDIKEWTTEGKYFETNKDSLQSIMDELISASCIDPGKQGGHRRPGNGYLVQWFIVSKRESQSNRQKNDLVPNTLDLLWGSKALLPYSLNGRKV